MMAKMTDTFWWLKVWLPKQNLHSYTADNAMLLMPLLDFKVNSRLKDTQRYFCGMYGIS